MKRGRAPNSGTAPNKDEPRRQAAESLAIAALTYLVSEDERLGRFLAVTGIGPDQIRAVARDRGFLAGVLDYFSGNEALLIAFAQDREIDPAEVERASTALGGGWKRDLS